MIGYALLFDNCIGKMNRIAKKNIIISCIETENTHIDSIFISLAL